MEVLKEGAFYKAISMKSLAYISKHWNNNNSSLSLLINDIDEFKSAYKNA